MRRLSDNGKTLLKVLEGFSAVPYQDVGGHWTIGWGTRISDPDGDYDLSALEELFEKSVEEAEKAVNRLVSVQLTQSQFDALVLFVYNVGVGNFQKSTLLKKLNKGDYEGAAREFLRWIYVDARVAVGLVERRFQERILFEYGIYNGI